MGFDINRLRNNKPSEWLEWLSDDPPPATQRKASVRPQVQPARPMQPRVHQAPSYAAAPARAMRPDIAAPVKPSPVIHPAGPPGMAQPIQPMPPKVAAPIAQPQPHVTQPAQQPAQSPIRPMARQAAQRPVYQPQKPQAVPSVISNQKSTGSQAAATPAAVSIQISMPKFKRPKLPALPYKRMGIVAGGMAVIVGMSIGSYHTYTYFTGGNKVAVKGASVSATPTFDPLAPQDKPQLGTGNGAVENTAYDKERGLYAFKDNLMGFGITVSQQALPDNLKKSPGNLKKVAESMGGDQTQVDTAFGMAYISTDTKNDAQRVVFIYQDKMVFMNSYKRFDNDTWKYYIETLR